MFFGEPETTELGGPRDGVVSVVGLLTMPGGDLAQQISFLLKRQGMEHRHTERARSPCAFGAGVVARFGVDIEPTPGGNGELFYRLCGHCRYLRVVETDDDIGGRPIYVIVRSISGGESEVQTAGESEVNQRWSPEGRRVRTCPSARR